MGGVYDLCQVLVHKADMHLKISNKPITCSYATAEGSGTPNASSAKNRARAPCTRQKAGGSGAEEGLTADYHKMLWALERQALHSLIRITHGGSIL